MTPTELINQAKKIHIDISEEQAIQLSQFSKELIKWSETFNLCGPEAKRDMLNNIIECISIIPELSKTRPKKVADFGSGAGFPGIVIAIMKPEWEIYNIEPITNRCIFQKQIIHDIQINNCHVINKRAEQWQNSSDFDIITARAVATPDKIVNASKHLLNAQGCWKLMIGLPEKILPLVKDMKPEIVPCKDPRNSISRNILNIYKSNI